MKVKIVYEYGNTGFWAKGFMGDRIEYATGQDFTTARKRLIEKLIEVKNATPVIVPPDEEVEI